MGERPPFEDPELEAMAQVIEALEPFDKTVCDRILAYVKERRQRMCQDAGETDEHS